MSDIDTRLRELAERLRADPDVDGAEVRSIGRRRRVRRQIAMVCAATVVTVAAAFSGASLWNSPTPPAGPQPAVVPVWAERIADDPQVFRHAPGGSGLAGATATVEGTLAIAGGCLVLQGPPAESPEGTPRVLVLPVGATWTMDGGGMASLGAEGANALPLGTKITARVGISERADRTFSDLCPGSAGYAALATPDAVVSAQPPSAADTTTPATLDTIPLADGLEGVGDGSLDKPSRDLVGQVFEGLGDCLNRGT
ncbi:MAG: hypothetical protein LCH82_07365 [Actinobacteria bacterium]|nr:hypothetical protein [Actinomycetota bacterium]